MMFVFVFYNIPSLNALDTTVRFARYLSFVNTPLIETINFTYELVEEKVPIGTPIDSPSELILFCNFNVQFAVNNIHYQQKYVVFRSSSLGPSVADVFMAKLETQGKNRIICLFDQFHLYPDDPFVFAVKKSI